MGRMPDPGDRAWSPDYLAAPAGHGRHGVRLAHASLGTGEPAGAARDGPEPREQFARGEGLRNVIVRPDFQADARVLRRNLLNSRYLELPVTGEHAVAVSDLPMIHKDPFDRILVAQSIVEGITLLTADPMVARYSANVRRV